MTLWKYCHRRHRSLSCFWTCQHLWCLHYKGLYYNCTCLHHRAWAAPGLVWTTGAGAAPLGAYTTDTWPAHGRATHRGLSFTWTCLHYRDHCCFWTCLYATGAWAAPGLVWKQTPVLLLDLSTLQRPLLHFDMSTLNRPVPLLELSTTQYKGLSCTWTYLDSISLCCFYWGIYTTGTWALDGRVCSTEYCASPGWVSSKGPLAALGRFWTTGACAAPGLIYTTETCAALGPV
jgi:hypothetical protein